MLVVGHLSHHENSSTVASNLMEGGKGASEIRKRKGERFISGLLVDSSLGHPGMDDNF